MDQIKFGEFAKLYPRLNTDIEICKCLNVIMLSKNKDRIEECYKELENIYSKLGK